jgi:hypothetical protein
MTSDLISNIRKRLQARHPIGLGRTKSKDSSLINEIQIQDSCSSDEESVAVPTIKPAMICKLAQIPTEI